MSRKKEERFQAIKSMENVYELIDLDGKGVPEVYFDNDNPVVVELGCGKGDYVIELARRFPRKNFIGIDIKGDRIYIGAKKALNEHLLNVVFIRTYVQFLKRHIKANYIDELWITFPDPYPSSTKSRKRLTSPFFLNIYKGLLKENGIVHFKTDDPDLFEFTLDTLKKEHANIDFVTDDLYNNHLIHPQLTIKTTYEKRHLANGKKIKYIRFQL